MLRLITINSKFITYIVSSNFIIFKNFKVFEMCSGLNSLVFSRFIQPRQLILFCICLDYFDFIKSQFISLQEHQFHSYFPAYARNLFTYFVFLVHFIETGCVRITSQLCKKRQTKLIFCRQKHCILYKSSCVCACCIVCSPAEAFEYSN